MGDSKVIATGEGGWGDVVGDRLLKIGVQHYVLLVLADEAEVVAVSGGLSQPEVEHLLIEATSAIARDNHHRGVTDGP